MRSVFASVPPEVASVAFQFLSLQDICVARRTCRRLRLVADGNVLWSLLCRSQLSSVSLLPKNSVPWKEFARTAGLVSPGRHPQGEWVQITDVVSKRHSESPIASEVHSQPNEPTWKRLFDTVRGSAADKTSIVGFVSLSQSIVSHLQPLATMHSASIECNLPTIDQEAGEGQLLPMPCLQMFDCFYESRPNERVVSLLLTPNAALDENADQRTRQIARREFAGHLQRLFAVCGNMLVVFDGEGSKDGAFLPHTSSELLRSVGKVMKVFGEDHSLFCTSHNTPDVTFVRLDAGISKTVTDNLSFDPLPEIFGDGENALSQWLLHCTNSVRGIQCSPSHVADVLRDTQRPKPLRLPGWMAPIGPRKFTPEQALLLIHRVCQCSPDDLSGIWTGDLAMMLFRNEVTRCKKIYSEAMQLEIDDTSRPVNLFWVEPEAAQRAVVESMDSIYATKRKRDYQLETLMAEVADTNQLVAAAPESDMDEEVEEVPDDDPLPAISFADETIRVPMELESLAELHDVHYFAALRTFTAQLLGTEVAGDVVSGQILMEMLKTELNTLFRAYWRDNQDRSKAYCRAVVERTMAPLELYYVTEGQPMLKRKDGLRSWYSTLRNKIEEYCVKAKGGRKIDVLWEYVTEEVVKMENAARKIGCYGPEAGLIAESVRKELTELQRRHMATRNEVMLCRQRESARATVFIGQEYAAAAKMQEAYLLQQMTDDMKAWEMQLLAKQVRSSPQANFAAVFDSPVRDSIRRERLAQILVESEVLKKQAQRAESVLSKALLQLVKLQAPKSAPHSSAVVVRIYNAIRRAVENKELS